MQLVHFVRLGNGIVTECYQIKNGSSNVLAEIKYVTAGLEILKI